MNTRFTDKPWGTEEILEQNDHYMVKRIVMEAGHCCSLQYHEEKHETFIVLEGLMRFTHEGQCRILTAGNYLTILPGEVHRMESIAGVVYLECSTNHPDDVVRLEDRYGRLQSSDHDLRDGLPSGGSHEVHE